MLLSDVSLLVVAQWSSEIPEGLMNDPVYIYIYIYICVCVCVCVYTHNFVVNKNGFCLKSMTERYSNELMHIMSELYVKRGRKCPFACNNLRFKILIAYILPSVNLISEFSGYVGRSIVKFANGYRDSILCCSLLFCPIYFRFIGTIFPVCVVTGVYPFQ